ncbi:hypothetical protein HPP92_010091 [Vanilla planifolia]|uniref:Late embryogenesis abundant protein LEA-2 subgroup domain-containing protein n=1 Tax=Vanilla planifolia TaxID=51239 RepID=A0A835QWI8_VANPL|nr:hypothetical protein HPP92_010082 [Vanilla planifolia]KAG0479233.1 hypothetical protein HPP92_010091 [Vanilla planifolia]
MSSSPTTGVLQTHNTYQLRQSRTVARTRFYVHRVRESLLSRVAMFFCSILLTLLLIVGIVLFVVWLSLRPHRPRIYLSSFSFPSITPSSTISFNVTARNPNAKIAISYGDFSAAVFYSDRLLASSAAVFSAFYQPPKNTTDILGQIGIADRQDVGVAGISGYVTAGRVELRLELNSMIRFRLSTWDTHQHRLHVSCEMAVGPEGNLLPEFQGKRCSVYFG